MKPDYTQVTEISGEAATREQVQRLYARYHFARQYCQDKDVLELGCGSGQGLGYLARVAKNLVAGDYSAPLLRLAQRHYQERIPLMQLDAQILPFRDQSFDVLILFEAIYYLPDCAAFARECARVLRPGGTLLLCTANKDLPDFNPSPYSHHYFSPPDFVDLLRPLGFQVDCFGDCPVDHRSPKQRFLSFLKRQARRWQLIPKTMSGKKLLKRLVFGGLVPMPAELAEDEAFSQLPRVLAPDQTDTCHKVILVAAHLD